jgi:hypothetical protein
MKQTIKISGRVKLVIKHPDGRIEDTGWIENLITSAGKAAMAGLVGNTGSITAPTYLAVGTSSTAVLVGDTALNAEITDTGLARAVATISRVTTSVTNDTLRFVYSSWTATGTKTVEEVGILNASSGGILLTHALTTSRALVNGSLLSVTYDIKFA